MPSRMEMSQADFLEMGGCAAAMMLMFIESIFVAV
jgi:hypothetical protein